jgi:hypothetical protein
MELQTHDEYRTFLTAFLEGGYRILTIHDAVTARVDEPFVILRHDIERSVARVATLADIEEELGVRSTLYVRTDTRAYRPSVLARLQSRGFEIGYHYNTLDRADGDLDRAAEMFVTDLARLRTDGLEIRSATAHGDPWKKRSTYTWNWELLQRRPELAEGLDDIGPWGLRFPLQERILNFSDANLQWNRGEVTRRFLVGVGRRCSIPRLYLLIHSDYWSSGRTRALGLTTAAGALRFARLGSNARRWRGVLRPPSTRPASTSRDAIASTESSRRRSTVRAADARTRS